MQDFTIIFGRGCVKKIDRKSLPVYEAPKYYTQLPYVFGSLLLTFFLKKMRISFCTKNQYISNAKRNSFGFFSCTTARIYFDNCEIIQIILL